MDFNKVVADKAVEYLKNRMLLNQKILKIGASKNNIMYEEFMEKYNDLKIKIWSSSYNPQRNELVLLTNKFVERHINFIVLSEEKLNELMQLVHKGIETYGIGDIPFTCNENNFLRIVLRKFQEELRNQSNYDTLKYQCIDEWLDYLFFNDDIGFYKELSGKLMLYNNEFSIKNHNGEILCMIDKNGNFHQEISLEEENIKIASNIYIGYLNKQEVAILYCNNYNQKIENKEELYTKIIPINSFLEMQKLDFLKKIIYTENDLKKIKDTLSKIQSLTSEEKEQIERIIQIATKWWLTVIQVNNRTLTKNIRNKNFEREGLKKFKKYLENTIRNALLENDDFFVLKVDNNPDKHLSIATYLSQLKLDFPCKTTMWISKEEVKVSDDTIEEALYHGKQKKL